MGIQDLQAYLESGQVEGSCVGVDLVRIARSQSNYQKQSNHNKKSTSNQSNPAKFSLVIDAECCLDRLYGGYFSDWVCGGQWNRVMTFLGQFISSLNAANIDLAVFFNGCTEPQRTEEWIAEQLRCRAKITRVLRHLINKGTPPPKIWWTPPSCLKSTLRLVLRNLSISVFVTMDDHKQEVIAYCRENGCHALVADDAEYIAFNPPRYFSARQLKLTYKGTLETKEYLISELTKSLQLTTEQLCILAALLGNYLLPESELTDLHKKLKLEPPTKSKDGTTVEGYPIEAVKAVAAFVRKLQSKELDDLGLEIFGVVGGERAAKFKQAVQYYTDGTNSGFLRFKPYHTKKNRKSKGGESKSPGRAMASDANPGELAGLYSRSEVIACLNVDQVQETPEPGPSTTEDTSTSESVLLSAEDSSNSSSATSPSRAKASQQDAPPTQPPPQPSKPKKQVRLVVEEDKITLPPVASEIMRTVSERHTKGLMSPLIHQILTQGEVKLPVVMEDEGFKEIPGVQQFYKPLRSMLYAVLFNLNHLTYMTLQTTKSKEKDNVAQSGSDGRQTEIRIKEWIWSKQNPYEKPEIVRAEPLGWGVPTVQRLWFGTTVDDKRRRLRAYLTVMRSDAHLMLNPSHVPQHLLIMATVLRYIMSAPESRKLLRRHELDAIIAMVFDPHLAHCDFNQELQVQVECVTPRNVQLGSLIMTGIEYALAVNDACGAPIPWLMTCPWLFFDGKLLHSTLARAMTVKSLLELCEYRIHQVMKVETMRAAILEGLFVQWERPNIPISPPLPRPMGRSEEVHQVMPAGMNPRLFRNGPSSSAPPRSRDYLPMLTNSCGCVHDVGEGFRYVSTLSYFPFTNDLCMTTGGRLEIAGVVVGNWGANCRLHPNFMLPPPQITSVGGSGGYNGHGSRPSNKSYQMPNHGPHARGTKSRPSANKNEARFTTRLPTSGNNVDKTRESKTQGKKKSGGATNKKDATRKGPRGRGTTIQSPITGEIIEASQWMAQMNSQEEQKKILTHGGAKKQHKANNGKMVNGDHKSEAASDAEKVTQSDQFADALELPDLMARTAINGESPKED